MVTACSGGPGASCALPRPVLSSGHVAPGDRITVRVDLDRECVDTNHPGPPLPPKVWHGIRVSLVQGAAITALSTVDSDAHGQVSADVAIPAGATPGRAAIRVDFAEDAALTID